MPYHGLSTAKVARAAGCHPNTIRLYEQIGFLSPAERSPKGYRLFTGEHLDQARLARLILSGGWPGRLVRRSSVEIIRQAAARDWQAALEQAHRHRSLVRLEREYAETAAAFLEGWAQGDGSAAEPLLAEDSPLWSRQAARLLGVTVDTLRSWERSGLIDVPRSPENRYRCYYAAQIGRLRVIRVLRQAGYSLMAILRMLLWLDSGAGESVGELRAQLDTPRPDEDAAIAADRWISTLAEQECRAEEIIRLLEELAAKYSSGKFQTLY